MCTLFDVLYAGADAEILPEMTPRRFLTLMSLLPRRNLQSRVSGFDFSQNGTLSSEFTRDTLNDLTNLPRRHCSVFLSGISAVAFWREIEEHKCSA